MAQRDASEYVHAYADDGSLVLVTGFGAPFEGTEKERERTALLRCALDGKPGALWFSAVLGWLLGDLNDEFDQKCSDDEEEKGSDADGIEHGESDADRHVLCKDGAESECLGTTTSAASSVQWFEAESKLKITEDSDGDGIGDKKANGIR